MTSSLVGSEMCIRDSFKTLPPQLQNNFKTRQGGRKGGTQGGREGENKSCLLYTSDAADDM
eukprot:1134600-Prorocentrum_lima.AAC.1